MMTCAAGQQMYLIFVSVLVTTALLQLLLSLQFDVASSAFPSTGNASAERFRQATSTPTILPGDRNCIFRDSPLYRSVFVYPSPGEPEWTSTSSSGSSSSEILSEAGRSFNASTHRFPWQSIEERTRRNEEFHFRMRDARSIQYTTELLVRDILTHPDSCLRSNDPTTAKLFFVPYMVSMEWHNGTQYPKSFETSPYGQAIIDILDEDKNDYQAWETVWGYTSKFWKRRQGADHILVMSESCHGLSHPRACAGPHDVLIQAQKQLAPPIIISIVTSQTFVNMYPQCTAKNVIVPNPNPDGRWFNGRIDRMAKIIANNASFFETTATTTTAATTTTTTSGGAVVASLPNDPSHRPLAYYYKAGNHGSCRRLRQQLETTFEECSPTGRYLQQQTRNKLLPKGYHFPHAFRHATFCPCPGGDAPNAKRYFDAVMAGCIPLILSSEFVWPYSNDIPGNRPGLIVEKDISIRLPIKDFMPPPLPAAPLPAAPLPAAQQDQEGEEDGNKRKQKNQKAAGAKQQQQQQQCSTATRSSAKQTIQSYIESIPTEEIARLQRNLPKAAAIFAYYEYSENLPDNPLREGILPNGAGAHALVQALADRAYGQRWPECQKEIQQEKKNKNKKNKNKTNKKQEDADPTTTDDSMHYFAC